MPRRVGHDETLYLDEAEGFILEHALVSPPRTWPPRSPTTSRQARVISTKRKMDWEEEVRAHEDDPEEVITHVEKNDDADKERCVICLMALRDRTIVGACGHEFCFECIGMWSNQSRRCPLCSADMAPFLLHDLDNSTPTKFYLPPLPERRQPTLSVAGPSRRLLPEERDRLREADKQVDELDVQVQRRREIYQYGLYAKHIGSNPYTRFRPNPTPRQIAEDPVLVQRATAFLRRELRVWSSIDVEFLTTYVLSLLKAIDIRSEPAVRLLAEFLDPPSQSSAAINSGPEYPNGAEHLVHELYSFLRSPYKELRKWDEIVQYDAIPSDEPPPRSPSPPLDVKTTSSSRYRSRSRSQSRSASYDSESSHSHSPSRRSRSRSRSASRSRPRGPPRDPRRRDTFIAPRSPNGRRWDEADSWVDPEHAAWMEEQKKKAEERREKKRRQSMPLPPRERIELLPSPPPRPLRMDEEEIKEGEEAVPKRTETQEALSIRGAAASTAKLSIAERLAKAKAEAAANSPNLNPPQPSSPVPTPPPLVHSISEPTQPAMNKPGVRAAVQARLKLRLKLASEKRSYVFNLNESRAQELRAKILEAKARREADETDAVLREMDKVDRAREVRRRLMVLKMMAAETESERRARELKEKLLGDRKAKMLKAKLLERKNKAKEQAAEAVTG
ncbi:hypothetical protein DB88DRAFT_513526 [Papiliotrema laurentii]|uniref:RING-type E3 ubiquitin transferase n=1 Tax=Papiliotrema laurentii TaxID=5418 RepID=A0AAD9CRX8_PAPLA|nr:hypothetical protein DB88DRAFT_513526 [Papiliotrema laurentii]